MDPKEIDNLADRRRRRQAHHHHHIVFRSILAEPFQEIELLINHFHCISKQFFLREFSNLSRHNALGVEFFCFWYIAQSRITN
jgi:hypothetical protein